MGWNALYAKEKDYWRDFAEGARRQGSPLYALLAGAIDGDESLKALLPSALAEIPPEEAVCVYHTIVTYQFSAAMREELESLLTAARRPVWHLSLEFDGQSGFAVTLAHHRDGLVSSRILGSASAHGAWLAWQKG